ncbi:TPA: restriction endonuclease subunit S [Staphylococcus aureus]|nr:restriction endonuclease subunit S [Staphylococcus aureus]
MVLLVEPFLRFSEFNKDWEYNFFSEIVTNKTKRIDPKKEESLKDIELDSIEQNTGRLLNTYISKDFTSQKNKFDKGSVLYSKLRPYLNKYYYAKIDGVCSSEIWVLNSLNNEKLSNLFLYYFIQSDRFKNVANKSAGSKMPRADWGLIENIKLYKGLIEEQEKIGEFFSKLDRQIELEEQKLEKLEEQKKGYMQQIFSQKLRFKDESGNEYPEWEEKKLFDVVKYLSSKRSSNYYSEDIIHGQYPVYDAVQEISRDTNFDIEESYISILKDGAGVGRLNLRPGKSSVIGTMGYLLPQNIDIKFLFYYLKTMNFNRFVIGSTIPHLYFKDYSKETILIPIDKSEQIKIGSFFIKLDSIINNKAKKIKVLKQRKQGFLQKMFV